MWYNLSMVNVYVDDERATPPEFDVRTYTVAQTIAALQTNDVDLLSLDNDLGSLHWMSEGRYITLWLAEQLNMFGRSYYPRRVAIHSANPVARSYMVETLLRYGPYIWDTATQTLIDDSRM
jgi:hypothetical protein